MIEPHFTRQQHDYVNGLFRRKLAVAERRFEAELKAGLAEIDSRQARDMGRRIAADAIRIADERLAKEKKRGNTEARSAEQQRSQQETPEGGPKRDISSLSEDERRRVWAGD